MITKFDPRKFDDTLVIWLCSEKLRVLSVGACREYECLRIFHNSYQQTQHEPTKPNDWFDCFQVGQEIPGPGHSVCNLDLVSMLCSLICFARQMSRQQLAMNQ